MLLPTPVKQKKTFLYNKKRRPWIQGGVLGGTPNGIRTHVSALRGRRPRPLDNGGKWLGNKDLNLDNTSQSRRCCRYTIPHHSAFRNIISDRRRHYSKQRMLCQLFFCKFEIFSEAANTMAKMGRKKSKSIICLLKNGAV